MTTKRTMRSELRNQPQVEARGARDIRRRHASGETLSSIAADLGIAVSSVHAISRGQAHPPRLPPALVDDNTLERLEQLAADSGVTVEELVAGAARRLAKTG